MQVVIDIPDEWKTRIECNRRPNSIECGELIESIWKGKILPKGHGRLIDADILVSEIKDLKKSPWYKDNTNFAYLPRKEAVEIIEELIIEDASTIIEAAKED